MTNEEKSKEIAVNKQSGKANGFLETYLISYESAMEMAEWKEEQMIEKAVKWMCCTAEDCLYINENGVYDINTTLLEDRFRAAMKEDKQ